jgi:hypothetical protein
MTLQAWCYVGYVLGQLLFVLKRAASAIRSKTNPIRTRRAYIYANWDVLTIRLMLEGVVFVLCWQVGFTKILALFTSWQSPIKFPASPVFYFAFGFFIDAALDWYGQSSVGPAVVREFVKENVPDFITTERTTVAVTQTTDVTVTKENIPDATPKP